MRIDIRFFMTCYGKEYKNIVKSIILTLHKKMTINLEENLYHTKK